MKKSKHTILCIDDDSDFLDSLRIILEGSKYAMIQASSAEEGLKIYKQKKPDVVIVDLMMEEIDAGTNFVKEARAIGPTPPIFMLSSVGDKFNSSTDYTELGLAGVLQKPLKPDILLSTLQAKLK